VPVRASVFDDDFFRVRTREGMQSEERAQTETATASGRGWEVRDVSVPRTVQHEAVRAEVFHVHAAAEEPVRGQGAATGESGNSETDELDIPAFLRRGN